MPSKKRTFVEMKESESGLEEGLRKKPLQPSVTGPEFLSAKQVFPFLSKNKKSKYTKKEVMNLAGYLSNRGPIVLQHESAEVYNEVSAILRKIDELNTIPTVRHYSFSRL
jgi:isopenicillin N synthase-like dioxygenase